MLPGNTLFTRCNPARACSPKGLPGTLMRCVRRGCKKRGISPDKEYVIKYEKCYKNIDGDDLILLLVNTPVLVLAECKPGSKWFSHCQRDMNQRSGRFKMPIPL